MPNLVFKYSRIYNTNWKKYYPANANSRFPDFTEILEKKSKLEKYWETNGERIIDSISNISGLKWREEDIDVYFIAHGPVFSDPLTLSISKGKDPRTVLSDEKLQIDLIHELIHNLLSQNHENLTNFYNWRDAKYEKEKVLTKIHIAVHAIEMGVMINLGREDELDEIIAKSSGSYREAWNIVEEEEWQNIIKNLTFNK